MKVLLVYPTSQFHIKVPGIIRAMTKAYDASLSKKIAEKHKQFPYSKNIKTSPSWGYRILPSFSYIARSLKKFGHSVSLYHEDFELDKGGSLNKTLNRVKPDLVLIIATTVQYSRAVELNKIIKNNDKDVITVYAGILGRYPKKVIEDGFDVCISGEADEVFIKIVNSFEHKNVLKSLLCLEGVYVKENKKGVIGKGVAKVLSLDELPKPYFQIFPKKIRKNACISWATTKGCPYSCNYCYESYFWSPLREKSLWKVKEELELYKKYFPFDHIFFHDSTFNTLNWKNKLKMIKEDLGMYFSINLRADHLSNKDVEFLKKYTPLAVFSGVENANQDLLAKLNRKQDLNFLLRKIFQLNKFVPFITLSFILGLPGETEESIKDTTKLMVKLLKKGIFQTSIRLFTPYPGTPVYANPSRFGLKILSHDFGRYDRYSFPPIIRYKNFNEFELYSKFLSVYSKIISTNLKTVGMNIEDFGDEIWNEANSDFRNIYKVKYSEKKN